MKKIIAVLMCLFLLTLCVVSCAKNNDPEESDTVTVTDVTTADNSKDTKAPETNPTTKEPEEEEEQLGEAGGDKSGDTNWTKPY